MRGPQPIFFINRCRLITILGFSIAKVLITKFIHKFAANGTV